MYIRKCQTTLQIWHRMLPAHTPSRFPDAERHFRALRVPQQTTTLGRWDSSYIKGRRKGHLKALIII